MRDLRKKPRDLRVVKALFNFKDLNTFISNMSNLGYNSIGTSVLIKDFNYEDSTISVNINVNSSGKNIQSITAYDNSEILAKIPENILLLVEEDLSNSIK